MESSKYAVDLPYPSIENIVVSPYDAKLLLSDYAGFISELSAITQYVYHHFYAEKDGRADIARDLIGIGIIEMRHLEKIGSMIIKLGADPKFVYPAQNNKLCWWDGSKVDYEKELKKIILSDIKEEEDTICKYSKHAKLVQPEVANMLNRIILDEQKHIEILDSLYKSI